MIARAQRFWWHFSLLHGVVLALLSAWPIPGMLEYFWLSALVGLLVVTINVGVWIGILMASIWLIDRYIVPLIKDEPPPPSMADSP